METMLLVATANGLAVCRRDGGGWQVEYRTLAGRQITSVIAREGVILAGTTRGVYRSDDLGATWREASAGLDILHVRWLAFHPDVSDFEFAGTEPAGIFISRDGGESWRACPEVAALREANGWYLPYSPEAGCVRGFAFHGQRAYAAVEVGGLLVSDHGGTDWQLAPGSSGDPQAEPRTGAASLHPDVHSVAVHPTSPYLVYAPTGGGFYASQDGGTHWTELYDCYCRATWLDPLNPDHILLGPARGVDAGGRIEQTLDGGRSWTLASAGLQMPWKNTMVERFVQNGDELLAVLSNGELLAAALQDLAWQKILPEIKDVSAVSIMHK